MPALVIGGNTVEIFRDNGHEERLAGTRDSDRAGGGQLNSGHTVQSPRLRAYRWRTPPISTTDKATVVTELEKVRITVSGDLTTGSTGTTEQHIVTRWRLQPLKGPTRRWVVPFETVEAST